MVTVTLSFRQSLLQHVISRASENRLILIWPRPFISLCLLFPFAHYSGLFLRHLGVFCPHRDLNRRLVYTLHLTEYFPPARPGEYPSNISQFWNLGCCEKYTKAPIWLYKYARILPHRHYPLLEANSFPQASLSGNRSLIGTDNVRRQISASIFSRQMEAI